MCIRDRIWAGRAGVPIVKAGEGADPAAVIFDTVKSATARGYDMVIADTAGRLHNKSNLMSELSKISRSVRKAAPEASLETLLVLDAITGQNAISQAKEFCKAADATGIILTKLDGTAKGGCVVAVKQRLGLPVRFIGVGEGIDDLIPFTPEGFVEELIKELKSKAKHSDGVLLATDPDREGEAISWHLANILGLDPHEPNRVTFDEITKKGVKEGMAHPRAINEDLFNAQQARRVLDLSLIHI